MIISMVASVLVSGLQPPPAPAVQPAPAVAEAPVVAEARAFMDAYATDLRAGNREAIAARYDRRGAYRMGRGEKHYDRHEAIVANYAQRWSPPAAFEWRDLSFEPLGPDAVVVAGTFLWTPAAGAAAIPLSYTGLLVRQDGELRIRLEDEDAAPQRP